MTDPTTPSAESQPPRKGRGRGPEAQKVQSRLSGFDLDQSVAWQELKRQFSIGVTHAELCSLARVVSKLADIHVDRDAQRDNRVLIKWFDENWAIAAPIVKDLHLRDENETIIGSGTRIP
jgi:hypothetical protein